MMTMTARTLLATLTAVSVVAVPAPRASAWAERPATVDLRPGHLAFEVVGEVNNFAATPDAPLGSSQQFGYVSNVQGVDSVFTDSNPAHQNETTALLTFFTQVTTTRVTAHGPFSIVIREGTTTFYRNSVPASFATPDSFQSGDPVLTSTIRQQVIVDTVEKTFTVVNVNTVTDSDAFDLGGVKIRIGAPGDDIRTSLVGVLRVRDGVPPPTGYFAGSAVGVARRAR
jgi:hypothetical protein